MSKKSKAVIAGAFAFLAISGFSLVTNADGVAAPGSSDDPVVTKSYVDEQIQKALGTGGQAVSPSDLDKKIADELARAKADLLNQLQNSGSGSGTASASTDKVTVIKLEQGQTLFGGAGSEMIVRTGKVLAYSSDEDGIPDVTAGKDLPSGTPVQLNHLLMFPRDGRGIQPDPKNSDKTDIYVMMKGNYLLMNSDGTQVAP